LLLNIEKLIYGGDGLARIPADVATGAPHTRGKAVFLPFVLAGERVEASLTEQKPGFSRARVDAIVEASPQRVEPACPYFERCGGCHYQHASYEHQLQIKTEILRETLRRMAKLEFEQEIAVHQSPPWNYRNRSRLQVQTAPTFAAGYYEMGSHRLLPVEECPISSPLINRGIAALWASGRAGRVPLGVREVEFFASADDTQMLVEISCGSGVRRASVREWAEEWRSAMPEVAGVVAFRDEASRSQAGPQAPPVKFFTLGSDHLIYETRRGAYRVSAGSFFQTNRFLTDELVEIVTAGESGALALDLYAGVGLFSTALSHFNHVISVESSQTSTADLSYNQPSNAEAVQASTEQYLARTENSGWVGKGSVLPQTFHKPDLAVIDPPRSGLGERVARLLVKMGAPRITYVSCDPATLARDLVTLIAAGYRAKEVHLVDLFPQTYHMESVVRLAK
jgi:23S rRNA (uracil1939-C5)-methyltransferase